MRVVGLDIHRVFAEAVMLEHGKTRRLGRVGMTRDYLAAFARTLTYDDHVASHDQLRQHLADFVAAYNFGRRLKTLKGLTPYEFASAGRKNQAGSPSTHSTKRRD